MIVLEVFAVLWGLVMIGAWQGFFTRRSWLLFPLTVALLLNAVYLVLLVMGKVWLR